MPEFYNWDIPVENDFIDYYEMDSSVSVAGWLEKSKIMTLIQWDREELTRKWKVRTNEEGGKGNLQEILLIR